MKQASCMLWLLVANEMLERGKTDAVVIGCVCAWVLQLPTVTYCHWDGRKSHLSQFCFVRGMKREKEKISRESAELVWSKVSEEKSVGKRGKSPDLLQSSPELDGGRS